MTARIFRTGAPIDVRLYCRGVKGLLAMRKTPTRMNDNDRICHLSERPIQLRTSKPREN